MALELLYKKNDNGSYEYSKIALSLQEKFVEVYTDEYQDTDFVQESILDAISGNKNRFMVGDIKQSIYKFRQARPEIFNYKYDNYKVLKENEKIEDFQDIKIILAKNFRSRHQVLSSINFIFEQIMSKKIGECSYNDIETLKYGATTYKECENVNYKTQINIVDLNKKENLIVYEESEDETLKEIFELERFEQEAIQIAKKIIELKKEFKVYNMKKETFEPIKYKDIVILLRGIKTKGVILEKVLKKFDIPVFSDASTNLFLSDEVELVMSFLKIIDNPLQDIDLTSIMYSIVGKFSLDDLVFIKLYKENKNKKMYDSMLYVKEDLQKINYDNLSVKEKTILDKINDFLYLLEKFKRYSNIYSISEILIRLYKDTNIYYQFALENLYENKKANLNLLVDIARDFETNTESSLSSYISYIDSIKYTTKGNSEAKILGENEDVVRIMTIHKSKGLEFPVVILADTNTNYMETDLSKEVIMHQTLGIGINVVNEDYSVTYPSVIKQAIKNIGLREIRSEELRMLYVALTRAKEKLIIFATLNDYEKFNLSQFIMYKENKIDSFVVSKNKSYFQNINMALKKDVPEDLFDVNLIKIELTDNSLNINENVNSSKFIIDDIIKKIENSTNRDIEKIEIVKNILDKNLSYEYEYNNDIQKQTRISVSALKEKYLKSNKDEEELNYSSIISEENVSYLEDNTIDIKEDGSLYLPNCLKDEKEIYSPVRKGILVHFILENLDFGKINTKDELKKYINFLIEEDVINKIDAKYINVEKIYKFLISELGIKIKKSKKIYKEEEFTLRKEDINACLIQGVIDLYYINENGNIDLVDFKTDRLYNKEEFIKKYKVQLDIYKEALEKLKNKKVENTYIYSFNLDFPIKLER